MRIRVGFVIAGIALLTVFVLGADEPTGPAASLEEKPSTPSQSGQASNASVIVERFVEAVNSAEPGAARKFVAEHLAAETWNQLTSAKCERLMQNLRRQSGGIRIRKVFHSSENSSAVELEATNGGHRVGLEIVMDRQSTNRARWVALHPMAPPPDRRAKPLPTNEVPLLHAIETHISETAALDLFSGVVLLAKGDEILLHRAWGMADAERGISNRTTTRFGSASVGKMFTGIAIAQLVEAGKLRFDDQLLTLLPDYPNPSAAQGVTLHHLLTHSADFGDPFDSPRYESGFRPARHEEWFPLFAQKTRSREPGKRHSYSNGGYLVLAAVVEKVTGQPFDQYVCEKIFRPAEMRETGCVAKEDSGPSIAAPHRRIMIEDPLGLEARRITKRPSFKRSASGMGEWQTTTEDLFRFARALRKNQLLSESMTREVTIGKIEAHGSRVKYGYGFYDVDLKGQRMVGHSGGGGDLGVAAEVEMLWDQDYTIVILSNYDLPETRRLAHDILKFVARRKT